MLHTVYVSFESSPEGRDYVGKHSTNNPYDDYKGSFKDNSFNPDSKIIIAYANTIQGAVWLERQFHKVFNVVHDPQFANQSCQTSTKFDRTGVPHSQETIRKIKDSNKETFKNKPEECRRRSEAILGDNNPSRRFPETDEQKEKRLVTLRETWKDPELRKRHSDLQKVIQSNPDTNESRSASLRKSFNNPEEKARRSLESRRRRWYVNENGGRKFCGNHPGEGWKLGYFWDT